MIWVDKELKIMVLLWIAQIVCTMVEPRSMGVIGMIAVLGRGKKDIDVFKTMLTGQGKRYNYCAPAKGLELRKVYFDIV